MTRQVGGVLVDLDGTLLESSATQRRSWTAWAEKRGLDPVPFIENHGMTAAAKIARFASWLDLQAEVQAIAAMEEQDTAGVRVLPGARELLESGREIAVVTSATQRLAHVRLEAADLPVPDVLITADTTRESKPSPTPYRVAAWCLGVAIERCDVVEDAPAGVRSGRAAGAGRVVAVTTTVGAEELSEAHVILPDVAAYLRLLEKGAAR